MRSLYLILFLFIFPIIGKTQSYIPLVKDSVHWFVASTGPSLPPGFYNFIYEYYSLGDTLINSKQYKKIYRRDIESVNNNHNAPYRPISNYSLFGVLREDTATKRVYSIIYQSIQWSSVCNSGQEELLYDFNMNLNDSVNDSMCVLPISNPNLIINNIQSVLFHGYPTIKYERNMGGFIPGVYYEGIGSWCGLFENEFDIEELVLWDYCIGIDSLCGLTNSINIYDNSNMVKAYPNPTQNTFTVEFESSDLNTYFKLFDVFGKTILRHQLISKQTQFNVGNLPKGIYFYEVSNSKQKSTGKLVIQ